MSTGFWFPDNGCRMLIAGFMVKKIFVQIYEVLTPSEALMLIDLGVDRIGSVVVNPMEWRIPSIRETIEAVRGAGAKSSLIPLYSDGDAVFRTLDYYRPDLVHFCEQLPCGEEGLETCEKLFMLQGDVKNKFPEIKIMRSIPIAPPGMSAFVPTLKLARMFEPASDYFLTDTMLLGPSGAADITQPVQGFVGITGKICDWETAANLVESVEIPVVLAGGMSPENVFDGILRVRPAGVDSCTGTNATDSQGRPIRFKKDPDKVRRFVEAARRAQRAA